MIAAVGRPPPPGHPATMPAELTPAELYRQMLRIRRFEETVLAAFPRGWFYGTTHTGIGQEANAVGVLGLRKPGEVVVSNHRCHGHYLAYGGSMTALAAELMGRATGVCGGRGGSQHLIDGDFYASGVLGGTLPLAVGMALAERRRRQLVIVFLGDGALGEGAVYESLNVAALWGLPVYFIVENNRYAQTTPIHLHLAGEIPARFPGLRHSSGGVRHDRCDRDRRPGGGGLGRLRRGSGPQALVLHTYRFSPHSRATTSATRRRSNASASEIRCWCRERGCARRTDARSRPEVEQQVREAFEAALAAPVGRPRLPHAGAGERRMTTVVASLNQSLRRSLASSLEVMVLGEDVLDPYGGAFKVTQGLSSAYPQRVLTTPVSEAGIVGLGVGMALRGLRPVVEIMFGDFLMLAGDALVNHAAKFRWVSNDRARVPLVVRTPMEDAGATVRRTASRWRST